MRSSILIFEQVHNNRLKHRLAMGPVVSGGKYTTVAETHKELTPSQLVKTKDAQNEKGENEMGEKEMKGDESVVTTASLRFKEVAPDCARNCSGSRGACTLRDGKEMCDCSPGYHGTSCEYHEGCGTHGCSNDGVCRYGVCFCALGFSGKHCT